MKKKFNERVFALCKDTFAHGYTYNTKLNKMNLCTNNYTWLTSTSMTPSDKTYSCQKNSKEKVWKYVVFY